MTTFDRHHNMNHIFALFLLLFTLPLYGDTQPSNLTERDMQRLLDANKLSYKCYYNKQTQESMLVTFGPHKLDPIVLCILSEQFPAVYLSTITNVLDVNGKMLIVQYICNPPIEQPPIPENPDMNL